jgi:hypothetical protein
MNLPKAECPSVFILSSSSVSGCTAKSVLASGLFVPPQSKSMSLIGITTVEGAALPAAPLLHFRQESSLGALHSRRSTK